ncbi:hypothetical protein FRC12_014999 [Ceratobasidium sp. 428]|nr:hypothetical protein FRC12_014999 [Ceratobasidium sp. 428]
MSEHDCMLSAFHSTKPSACVQALPLSEPVKRKVSASGEPTSETSKRARGSDLASLASTTEASELGTTVLPRTPCNKSFVEDLVTPTLTSQFNSTTMNDKAPNTPPRPTTPPKSTPDTRDTASSARSITPLRISTSCVDPMCVNPSDSWRRRHQQPDTPTTPTSSQCSSPSTTAQLPKEEAGGPFRYELSGHVFQHNKFYEEFLPVDQVIQTQVREGITASGDLRPNAHLGVSANNTWTIHETISLQRSKIKTFGALVEMLNVLGKGAYETYQMNNEGEQYFRQETLFLNHSSQVAPWDSLSDPAMSLDLAMSSGHELENWGNMQIIIECKSSDDKASQNDAYLQLAHYAQAVFAHQVYRLHVFGFSLCGSIVNFVRFDRSGLLHSSDIDLSIPSGAHSFVKHVITLLTIDTKKFGYDTRYSFGQDSEENLVDTLFKFPGSDQAEVVSEVLCHRKRYCCGRATCVCALGNDVHKGIWRPKDRPDEGETLALFEGVFGVCQVKAFDYSTYSTELTYVEEVVHSPSASFFYLQKWATNPSASAVQSVCSDTIDASSAPASCASDFPESSESVSAPTTPRVVRVKSDTLMPRGTSLFDVQNSLHLLMAIHDALMAWTRTYQELWR